MYTFSVASTKVYFRWYALVSLLHGFLQILPQLLLLYAIHMGYHRAITSAGLFNNSATHLLVLNSAFLFHLGQVVTYQ